MQKLTNDPRCAVVSRALDHYTDTGQSRPATQVNGGAATQAVRPIATALTICLPEGNNPAYHFLGQKEQRGSKGEQRQPWCPPLRDRWFADSPVGGTGFEPSVPREPLPMPIGWRREVRIGEAAHYDPADVGVPVALPGNGRADPLRMRSPWRCLEELDLLGHQQGPELRGETFDKIPVCVHSGPMCATVGVIIELPEM
jgi:hypothetical protein